LKKYKGSRSIKSPSRKRNLGEVKVNFNSLVKQEKEKFLKEWGAYMKEHYPDRYYSITGKPLPKKYQEKPKVQITPVNAYVPPQSKLSKEELDAQLKKEAEEKKAKEEKAFKKQQEKMMEQQRLEYNRRTAQKQQRLVHWCDANGPGNWKSIHSDEFENKYGAKKNKSYY
jgi:hypothetical protein